MSEMGIFETIYTTRAMRRFKPDPIPEDVLVKIVDAGIHAPSGSNRQSWGFVLVRDRERKRFLRDRYWRTWQDIQSRVSMPSDVPPSVVRMYQAAAHLAEHLDEAPVVLLACAPKSYEMFADHPRASTATIHASIYPAVQNILLACRALGVGSVLTTLHCFFEDEIKEELGIPDDLEIAALLPLGYPVGRFGPTTRAPVADVLHWDRWGNHEA